MPKYLILKHYRGAPATVNDVSMDQWAPEEVDAQALSPEGAWVRADEQRQPTTDGPFAETKDLIAGWYVVDVDGWDRAVELAGELSLAPGKDGKPIHEWLEVRPFYGAPSATDA